MNRSSYRSVWKVQHLLCYLSYIFKDISCFLEEKALGPMPPHRDTIHGFARLISSMSTLLFLTSLQMKAAALKFQLYLVQGGAVDSVIASGDTDSLCQLSLRDLFDIWACIKPSFGTLQENITIWSQDKTKAQNRESPLEADYKTMAKILSYAECLLFDVLRKLRPLLGVDISIDLHIFMKLGSEINSREKVEPQLYPINYDNRKPVGTVLPFQPLHDLEKHKIWHEYTDGRLFRYLYYNLMESPRYIETENQIAFGLINPELCLHLESNPVRVRQMFSRAKASRLIKDEDIWIGQERTSEYNRFSEDTTLRDVIPVSVGQKRIKKMVVSLHPTYLLLFRERGTSLVLQHEIPRANIVLVTHSFQGAMANFQGEIRQEVGVCWKSASTNPTSMAYLKLIFHDSKESKVWASCLAPKDVPYELIAEHLEGNVLSQLSNVNGEDSAISLGKPQVPGATPCSEDVTMDQAQRLLSRIKSQDLDLLDYRVVMVPRGLEAVVIQDLKTEASYAVIDVVVDETPSSPEAQNLPPGDKEETSSLFSYYFLDKPRLYQSNIGEYLEACHGSWHLSENPGHKTCYIEVPSRAISPPHTPEHNFQGALGRLLFAFIRAKENTQLDGVGKVEYRLYSMKLMVYSGESLKELEEWACEAIDKIGQGVIIEAKCSR